MQYFSRVRDLVTFMPELIGGPSSTLFKPELLNLINRMGIKIEPEEYDKLWKKLLSSFIFI